MKIINHDLLLDGIDTNSGASVHQPVRKMEEIGIISGSYIKTIKRS